MSTWEKINSRLFGETPAQQKTYIIVRLGIMVAMVLIGLVGAFVIKNQELGRIALLSLYIWGWAAVKAILRPTAAASLLAHNIVVIALAVLLWLVVGLVAGLFIFLIAVIRLIQLLVESKKAGKINHE